jgi:pseudouridine synthase
LIRSGRVTVNGAKITEPGAKADPDTDDIRVDGRSVRHLERRVYLVLNKPVGYVTTVRDPHADRTVMQLLAGVRERVYPVGRLDAQTAGLLVMTNDGQLAQAMLHPSHCVPRTYRAVVRGIVDDFAITDLRSGIALPDGVTSPAVVTIVERNRANNTTVLDLTLREGRKRQVRRMLDAVRHRVLALTRTEFGPISLQGLAPGTWRKLRKGEIEKLVQYAGHSDEQTEAEP